MTDKYTDELIALHQAFGESALGEATFDARDAYAITSKHSASRWMEILTEMVDLGLVVRRSPGILRSGLDVAYNLCTELCVARPRELADVRRRAAQTTDLENTMRRLCAWYDPKRPFTFSELQQGLGLNGRVVMQLLDMLRVAQALKTAPDTTPKAYWLFWERVPAKWKPQTKIQPKRRELSPDEIAALLQNPDMQRLLAELPNLFGLGRRRRRKQPT